MVCGVAGATAGNAALASELGERLVEGEECVGGWGEAELAVGFKPFPLSDEVEAEAACVPLGGEQRRPACDREGKTGDAFDALVSGGDEVVDTRVFEIEGHSAEAAHGVDDELAAVIAHDAADRFDGVEDAGGGLAVDDGDVGDRRVSGQSAGNCDWVGRSVLSGSDHCCGDAGNLGDAGDALAVSSVGEDEEAPARRDRDGDDGFHRVGAAAWHEHRRENGRRYLGQIEKTLSDGCHKSYEISVARAGIPEHRLLHRRARGQRARGEEQPVAGRGDGLVHGQTTLASARKGVKQKSAPIGRGASAIVSRIAARARASAKAAATASASAPT
jgi:hypothetical protein